MLPAQSAKTGFLKTVSFLLILCQLMNSTAQAAGIGAPYSAPASNTGVLPAGSFSDLLASIEKSSARVELTAAFAGSRPEVILHIQDAHALKNAQQNTVRFLGALAKKNHVGLVAVEGAEGELFPELFSFFPDADARREVADYYLDQGRLTAAEYLKITADPGFELFGAETAGLYDKNRGIYLELLDSKTENEKILKELEKFLAEAGHHILPPRLQEFYRRQQALRLRPPNSPLEYLH